MIRVALAASGCEARGRGVRPEQSAFIPTSSISPQTSLARFYQIDNKMDAVLRYNVVAAIPVVDEQRGKPAK